MYRVMFPPLKDVLSALVNVFKRAILDSQFLHSYGAGL